MTNTNVTALYAKYMKEIMTKGTMLNVYKVKEYNFKGHIHVAVHHVEDDGTVIGYTCYGEYWRLSMGDTFARYIPIYRTCRQ